MKDLYNYTFLFLLCFCFLVCLRSDVILFKFFVHLSVVTNHELKNELSIDKNGKSH